MGLWGLVHEQTPELKEHPVFQLQILRRQTVNSTSPKQSCLKTGDMGEMADPTPH